MYLYLPQIINLNDIINRSLKANVYVVVHPVIHFLNKHYKLLIKRTAKT